MTTPLKWATLAAILAAVTAEVAELPTRQPQLRHVYLNGTHMLEFAENRYLLINPSVWAEQELIIEVSPNAIYAFRPAGPDNIKKRTFEQMSENERQLLEEIRSRMIQVDTNPAALGTQVPYFSIKYDLSQGTSHILASQVCNPKVVDMGQTRVTLFGIDSAVGFAKHSCEGKTRKLEVVAGRVVLCTIGLSGFLMHNFFDSLPVGQLSRDIEPEFQAFEYIEKQYDRALGQLFGSLKELLTRVRSQLKALVGAVTEHE